MTAVHLAYPEKWQLCPVPDTNEAPSSCVAVFFAAEKAFISARAGSIRRIFGGEEIVSHFCFVVLPCLALPCLALPCLAAHGFAAHGLASPYLAVHVMKSMLALDRCLRSTTLPHSSTARLWLTERLCCCHGHRHALDTQVFNRGFGPMFLVRLVKAFVREVMMLSTRDSVFFDSPLSNTGIQQVTGKMGSALVCFWFRCLHRCQRC